MSYPARRAAQKSMLRSDKDLATIKDNRSKGMTTRRESVEVGNMTRGSRLAAQKKALPAQTSARAVQATGKPQLSQREQYSQAMNRAQKNGGSNGVGVGP